MGLRRKIAGGAFGAALLIAAPFVAGWEGLREDAYLDAVGVATICYGHTRGVAMGDYIPADICREMLDAELSEFLAGVNAAVTVDIPDTMRAALVSFAYNVGLGNFRRSTLLKKLNAGDLRGACEELPRWVYAGGKRLKGLENRRHAEKRLCLEDL